MKTFLTKLTSRKFILAIAVFLVALVGIDDNVISIVTASITAIAYMFSEAIVDKARAIKRTVGTRDIASVTKYVSEGENNADE